MSVTGSDSKIYTNLSSAITLTNRINSTNYYGNFSIPCFICNSAITNFTNNGIILGGGGFEGSDGANAFTNNNTITNFYNYKGEFLGGGGGGGGNTIYGVNTGRGGGRGGPGGGGGGGGYTYTHSINNYMIYNNNFYAGSLINGTTNAQNITPTFLYNGNMYLSMTDFGGGGGGPGGNGGNSFIVPQIINLNYTSNYTSIVGGSGGGRKGANGGGSTTTSTTVKPGNNSITDTLNFVYGGGGGASCSAMVSFPDYTIFAGGGGYGGGDGGYSKTGGGGGGGGGYGGHYNVGSGYYAPGNGGYSVYNNGTITNFTNGQGGTNYIYGPCFYAGNAPTNYYINIQSTTRYGQLFCTGWASTPGTINFNIDTTSTISSSATLYYVLVGVTPTNLSGKSVGNLYGYLWTLTNVAAGSSIFGVYAYHLNITAYQIYNISSLLSTNALNTSYYRHVALTISGNTHTIYLDGSAVATNINALNIFQYYPSTISKLLIGSAADLSYGYTGYIDDFKVFNRALPASDISSIYYSVPII